MNKSEAIRWLKATMARRDAVILRDGGMPSEMRRAVQRARTLARLTSTTLSEVIREVVR